MRPWFVEPFPSWQYPLWPQLHMKEFMTIRQNNYCDMIQRVLHNHLKNFSSNNKPTPFLHIKSDGHKINRSISSKVRVIYFIIYWISIGKLKLPSQNKPVLAFIIHDIPLRNIVEPLNHYMWSTSKMRYALLINNLAISILQKVIGKVTLNDL